MRCERCRGRATREVFTRNFGTEHLCKGCAHAVIQDGQTPGGRVEEQAVVQAKAEALQAIRESRGWQWGNDAVRRGKLTRKIYFIFRPYPNGMHGIDPMNEYLLDKAGRLRTWRTSEAVKGALAKLSGVSSEAP